MKNEKGFTLIELVVSIAVLSMLVVPFFGIFTNAAKVDMRSKKDLTANYLAQHLAAEAKENPMVHSGWTESTDGSSTVFTKDALDGDYSDYSAVLTYDEFNFSISSNGLKDLIGTEDDYSAVFEFTWDLNDKSLSYTFADGTDSTAVANDDTSNNVEINLLNGDDGINSFSLEFKVNNDNPLAVYDFTLAEEIDFIKIKACLDPDSNVNSPNKTIQVANNTKDQNNISRAIKLYVDKEDFSLVDNVDIIPSNANDDISFTDLDDVEITSSDDMPYHLTVEVSGYDPVNGEYKVLKKLITSVVKDAE